MLAVPHDKLTTQYKHIKEPQELGSLLLEQIEHFFENYKDLEAGKWVKVDGWRGSDVRDAVVASVEAAEVSPLSQRTQIRNSCVRSGYN